MIFKKIKTRYLKEMKNVVFDKDFAKENPDFEVYYIKRGVKKRDGLRYDITTIPPKMLGKEFARTKGHYHKRGFQELYNVLEGKAIFFFQKSFPISKEGIKDSILKEKGEIKDVFAVRAEKEDWVIVPRNYTHLTINPGKKELRIGNWISKDCENVYKELEELKGPCYFYTKEGWIKNKNYKKISKLHFEKPLKKRPKNLDFLK